MAVEREKGPIDDAVKVVFATNPGSLFRPNSPTLSRCDLHHVEALSSGQLRPDHAGGESWSGVELWSIVQ